MFYRFRIIIHLLNCFYRFWSVIRLPRIDAIFFSDSDKKSSLFHKYSYTEPSRLTRREWLRIASPWLRNALQIMHAANHRWNHGDCLSLSPKKRFDLGEPSSTIVVFNCVSFFSLFLTVVVRRRAVLDIFFNKSIVFGSCYSFLIVFFIVFDRFDHFDFDHFW